jgi:hypothetical protein
MKALTICQPYAQLIVDRQKLVENRSWSTNHRGRIYIHAGKSVEWLCPEHHQHDRRCNYGYALEQMPFGAIVGTADLVDCVWHDAIWKAGPYGDRLRRTYPWIQTHPHTNGPWCWILERAVKLEQPIPWRGAQGLFDIELQATAPAQSAPTEKSLW